MGITTFDTLKFVRRLEDAGVPQQQAEVQAEVLTEAFNVNLDSMVTKDYLATQFADQKAYVETRFAEQKGIMDARFAEQQTYIDTRFAELKAYVDTRFAEIEATMDKRFAEIKATMDKRFAEIEATMDKRFAVQKAYMDTNFARIDSRFRFFSWTQAIVIAAVVLPYLERLAAL